MKTRTIRLLASLAVLLMAMGSLAPATAQMVPMQAPDEAAMSASMTEAADWMLTVTKANGQIIPPSGSPIGEEESGGRVSMNGLALLCAYQVTGTQEYLDGAIACGDLVVASAEATASYVVDRTGVLVTEASGGFPNAQPGKVDDTYLPGYTGTLRFNLWESLQGIWLMSELYKETEAAKYQNSALLIDRMVGNEYYIGGEALAGLVEYVTLPNNGNWAQGGRASTWDHALLLKVISIATLDAPNLWRDRYDIITYVRSTQLSDGSFDDKDPLPNQNGPSETKHSVMITALYDLGRPQEGRKLADWAIDQQRPDGSFACPHDKDTIGDTAMAAMGVLPIGNVTVGGDALNWLIGQQRTDGSWNALTGLDIPTSRILSTQWTMLALHAGLTNYNLALDGPGITADPIWEGDPARVMGYTINLTVKNQGLVGVTGASVKIFDGPRENKMLMNQDPIDVPALGETSTSLEIRPETRGPHEVHVWVDFSEEGEFRNRDNNASILVNLNREPSGGIGLPMKDQLFGFGEYINFRATNIMDLDNDLVNLTWKDNVTGFLSHKANFSMVLIPGDHYVTLTLADGNGPSTGANVSFSVRQNIPPTVRISVPADDARYFDYQTIVFDASASSDAEDHYLTYTWESDQAGLLGYGDKISQKLGAGEHVITVWVDDSWANVSKDINIRVVKTFAPTVVIESPVHGETYVTTTRVSFDANGTFDPDSEILEYFWKSNINGMLSERPQFLTTLSVGHHFITLSVDDGNYNVSKTIEFDVSDNRAPMAIISSPEHEASFLSLDPIELNGSSSYDLEDPLTYFWVSNREGTLGDDPTIILYLARGDHTITLWVNDDHGHNISTSVEITILNLGPTAGISSPEPGTVFQSSAPVPFMSGTSFDPEDDKLTYEWFLRPSDGEWTQIGTTARLEKELKTPGHYDVKLIVSDGKESDEITSTFQVKKSDNVDDGEAGLMSNTVALGAIGVAIIIAVVIVVFIMKGRD